MQACEHGKNINRFRLSEKLEHAKQITSRHIYELDALTTVQFMARQEYIHQEGIKFKLDMARTKA